MGKVVTREWRKAKSAKVEFAFVLAFRDNLKGKLGDFFLFVQSFYRPKTKTSFNRQFSPKRPKLVKNQAKGSEIHQIRTKWHPSYCGNPSILSSDLAVKIKRSLQGSPVENKMLRSWMFFALPPKHPTSEHFIFNR